jgi:hypothetical protein
MLSRQTLIAQRCTINISLYALEEPQNDGRTSWTHQSDLSVIAGHFFQPFDRLKMVYKPFELTSKLNGNKNKNS